MAKGKIVKVSGPVVDVEFPESLPAIYNALTVEYKVKNQPAKVTLEVQQDLGDNVVRTISMAGTEGLKRGFEVIDTGGPISMPVGEAVMAFPEPALQRRPSVYRTRRQAGSCRGYGPRSQGDSRWQARRRSGGELLYEGRN